MSQANKEKEARKARYISYSEKEKEAQRARYMSHSKKDERASICMNVYRSTMQSRYSRCRSSTLQMRQRAYYNNTKYRKAAVLICRTSQCLQKRESPRALYSLSEPSQYTRELYVKDNISSDASYVVALKRQTESMTNAVLSMAARRVLHAIRNEQAGELINSARCSKYLRNPPGSATTQQHLSLTFTTRAILRSSMMLQYVLITWAYVILRKKSVRGKMMRGGPKNGIALLSVRFSRSRSAKTL